jgi:hypothetical protein
VTLAAGSVPSFQFKVRTKLSGMPEGCTTEFSAELERRGQPAGPIFE